MQKIHLSLSSNFSADDEWLKAGCTVHKVRLFQGQCVFSVSCINICAFPQHPLRPKCPLVRYLMKLTCKSEQKAPGGHESDKRVRLTGRTGRLVFWAFFHSCLLSELHFHQHCLYWSEVRGWEDSLGNRTVKSWSVWDSRNYSKWPRALKCPRTSWVMLVILDGNIHQLPPWGMSNALHHSSANQTGKVAFRMEAKMADVLVWGSQEL